MRRTGLLLLSWMFVSATLAQETTLEFQNGINGYGGAFDVFIGLDGRDIPDGESGNVIGSSVGEMFIDGRYFEEQGDTEEIQMLLRFSDIVGEGASQIPVGAHIASASLILETGETSPDAGGGGPYGVAPLLVEFSDQTTWDSFDGVGVSSDFRGPFHDHGFRGNLSRQETADVTRIVQDWVDGEENYGMVVRAGGTNGWQVFTTGATDTNLRPRLSVTYDSTPRPETESFVFQQRRDDYLGTSMVRLKQDGTTEDGSLMNMEFLDGPNADGSSPDDQALIRFDEIFASDGGPITVDSNVASATLIVSSADGFRSANTGSNGNFGIHQMLQPWDFDTTYLDFGGNGPHPDDADEVGPVLDTTGAVIADSEVYFDVTDAVRAWQSGDPNHGFTIRSIDTSDGWAIQWLDADNPPMLVVEIGEPTARGDFNGDGQLNDSDITSLNAAIRDGGNDAAFDLNGDQRVDADDRTEWVHRLRNTYFGDSNFDGEFNSSDFVFVFQAGQYEDDVAQNSTWASGDWNGDGDFDSGDFVTAFQDGGFELGPRPATQAVPEPTSLVWVLIHLMILRVTARRIHR